MQSPAPITDPYSDVPTIIINYAVTCPPSKILNNTTTITISRLIDHYSSLVLRSHKEMKSIINKLLAKAFGREELKCMIGRMISNNENGIPKNHTKFGRMKCYISKKSFEDLINGENYHQYNVDNQEYQYQI